MTSTVYRDPHGTITVKFGTAVYREYREYRPSLLRGHATVKSRLQLAVLQLALSDLWLHENRLSANIAKMNFDAIFAGNRRCLANFVRNFVIHSKSTNFNPEVVQLAE